MLIYFLRHGLTDYNAQKRYQGQRDIPLSAQGLAQLRKADIDPKIVYISTLQRTKQTAEVLFPHAKLVPVDALKEMCFGAVGPYGTPREAINKLFTVYEELEAAL